MSIYEPRRPRRLHPDDVFIGTCIVLATLANVGAFAFVFWLMRIGVI
jgi:hypothetical protein